MSYIPAGNNVSHWQSNAKSADPVRPNRVSATRSGSKRSYGPTKSPDAVSGKFGQILQGSVGGFGNYLLYRDAMKFQQAHAEEQLARKKDQMTQRAVGVAATSMLGGPSTHSPGKKRVGGPNLGPPRTQTGPQAPKDPFGRVAVDQFGPAVGGGRMGAWNQPTPEGNTATPQGPQALDPRAQRLQEDKQAARERPAGGNIAGTLKNVPKDIGIPKPGERPTYGQGQLFDF